MHTGEQGWMHHPVNPFDPVKTFQNPSYPHRPRSYSIYMKVAKLFTTGGSQAVRLPKEFRFEGTEVFVERAGDSIILRPKTKRPWPKNFFKSIQIRDSGFRRLPQGNLPPIPDL